MEVLVNTNVTLIMTGQSTDAITVYCNGVAAPVPLATQNVGALQVSVTITPTGTGPTQVVDVTSGNASQVFNVVAATSSFTLAQIQNAVLGSFQWDKSANLLTLYNMTGQPLAAYTITDAPTIFSRELLPTYS